MRKAMSTHVWLRNYAGDLLHDPKVDFLRMMIHFTNQKALFLRDKGISEVERERAYDRALVASLSSTGPAYTQGHK